MPPDALQTTALTSLPDVFLRYQQELWQAIDAHQVVVVEKSRRTGFSWAMGAVAVAYAARPRGDGGMDVLYMGYEKEMTREFIDYVADWATSMQGAAAEVEEFVFTDPDHPEHDIGAFRVRLASRFEVVALPSVPRALRGKQGLVILDEAAFMDDLEKVLKAAFALLIWGGKVVVISTHNGDTNPFNVLVQDIRAERARYHLMRLTFDEAIADGLCKRVFFTQGKEWSPEAEAAWRQEIIDKYRDNADEELHVIPNPSTGAYIPGPMIDARLRPDIPVLRLERKPEFSLWSDAQRAMDVDAWIKAELDPLLDKIDPDTPHAFGFDFARKGDVSAFVPLAILRSLVRRAVFVLEMRNIPFAQQRQVLWHIIGRVRRWRAGKMDATGNGMQIAEETVQRWGGWIEPVMMTEPWYRENMPPFKAAFEDATIELPRDRGVRDDVSALKLIRGVARVPDRIRDAEGHGKRHGDVAIAGALAIAASRAEPEIYGYEAARREDPSNAEHKWRDRPDTWDEDNAPPPRTIMPELRGGMMGGRR